MCHVALGLSRTWRHFRSLNGSVRDSTGPPFVNLGHTPKHMGLAAVLFKPPRQPDLPPLLSLTSTHRRGLRLLVQGMGADLSCPSYDGDFDDARDARIDDVAARHAHAERRRYALPTPPSERDEPSVMHEFRRENTSAAANVDREEALEKVCLPRLGGQFDFFESCAFHISASLPLTRQFKPFRPRTNPSSPPRRLKLLACARCAARPVTLGVARLILK